MRHDIFGLWVKGLGVRVRVKDRVKVRVRKVIG